MIILIRNLILIFLICFIVGAAAIYWAVNSPEIWSLVIQKSAAAALKKSGVKIKDVKVTKPQIDSEILKFEKISAWLINKEGKYYLQLDKPVIEGISSLLHKNVDLTIFFDKVKIESADLDLELKILEIESAFVRGENNDGFPFRFKAEEFLFNKLLCSQLKAKGEIHPSETVGKEVEALCYEGKIGARFHLSYAKMFSYQADVTFKEIDLSRLENLNREVFTNLRGLVDGNLHLSGDLNNVVSLESGFHISSGGKIRAELLKPLMPYIPQSVQRKDLEGLIRDNGLVSLEKGVVHLKSIGDEKISSLINLESRKLNLNTNLTVDVNVEGGIKNFYKHIIKTFKQGDKL